MAVAAVGLVAGTVAAADAAMPSPDDCAHGRPAVGVGEHIGSAAVCAGAGGHTAAYVGGNVLYVCGAVTVADEDVEPGDPQSCDGLADDPLDLHVYAPAGVPTRGLPAMYLLSGSGGDWDMWQSMGFNPQAIADRYHVVVVAIGGQTTWYVNWVDGTVHAENQFLSVVRSIDRTYGTSQDRNKRALVGLSMGGYGATLLGERHHDLFGNVVSMSGVNDIQEPYLQAQLIETNLPLNHYSSPGHVNRVWGNPLTNRAWTTENPRAQVCGLRSSWVWFSSGDGTPTAHDLGEAPFFALAGQVETGVRAGNNTFAAALRKHGLRFTYRKRHGVHEAYYWLDDMRQWLPTLAKRLAAGAPSPQPAPVSC